MSKSITVNLSEELIEFANQIGDGVVTQGIREALEKYYKFTLVGVAEFKALTQEDKSYKAYITWAIANNKPYTYRSKFIGVYNRV